MCIDANIHMYIVAKASTVQGSLINQTFSKHTNT